MTSYVTITAEHNLTDMYRFDNDNDNKNETLEKKGLSFPFLFFSFEQNNVNTTYTRVPPATLPLASTPSPVIKGHFSGHCTPALVPSSRFPSQGAMHFRGAHIAVVVRQSLRATVPRCSFYVRSRVSCGSSDVDGCIVHSWPLGQARSQVTPELLCKHVRDASACDDGSWRDQHLRRSASPACLPERSRRFAQRMYSFWQLELKHGGAPCQVVLRSEVSCV